MKNDAFFDNIFFHLTYQGKYSPGIGYADKTGSPGIKL
jgi:hypothetical protein